MLVLEQRGCGKKAKRFWSGFFCKSFFEGRGTTTGCVVMLAPLHRDWDSYQIDMGTSAVVFVFMSTQLFLSYAMICSSLRHVARAKLYAEILSKSQNNVTCTTMQDITILFHYFKKNNNFVHISSGNFRLLLQVLHALSPVLCSSDSSQQMPGARQFAVQQIGGHVCTQGVFQVPSF